MRVLVLKGTSPRHNYFAKEISEIKGIECKMITHQRLGKKRLKKMISKSPLTFFNRVSKYLFQKLRNWNKKEIAFFGNIDLKEQIEVESLNSKSSIELMKDFVPDLLVAFGIPIISNKVIEIPKFGAINLHGGISPEYKGGNTIFWPLYKGDLNKTGATLHYMVKKVDSGKIISKVYPDINGNDTEFTVSSKTFKYATEEMVSIIEWIKKHQEKILGKEQTGEGHLYLAKHRTFFVDLLGSIKIRKNLKNVSIDKRIEQFY
ncbi:formyl transferase [uncultured Aquimarina sp.]|uniref:formyl transferase n=1 Tax=uncultured Aquimarina sp. TaxID=575652 RepID=UPI0026165C94|nr:formyl transferase [uncultured Aquimarina sp.]